MSVKKVLGIIESVVTWVLVAFVALMVVLMVANLSLTRNDRSFLGLKAYTVLTDSMSDTFQSGDVVIVKDISNDQSAINQLKVGDIISFRSVNAKNTETFNQIVTHKISKIIRNNDGDTIKVKTYGTVTGIEDEETVENTHIKGVYQMRIPKMGSFIKWLQEPTGYILVIGVPFGLLIVLEVYKLIRNILKYKKEKEQEYEEEDYSHLDTLT